VIGSRKIPGTGSTAAKTITEEPVVLRGNRRVYADKEPELFMRSLGLQYKSAYLRVGKLVER
jgi:hypothetical protein